VCLEAVAEGLFDQCIKTANFGRCDGEFGHI
jgi:hypothetical protein